MKSLLFLILFLPAAVTAQVKKFRAFQISRVDPRIADPKVNWTDVNFLLIVNPDKMKIKIFCTELTNCKDVDIDLLSLLKNTTTDDGDELSDYTAVDEDGLRCVAELVVFKKNDGTHVATLILKYTDANIAYRLKQD